MFVKYSLNSGVLEVWRDSKNLEFRKVIKQESLKKESVEVRAGIICQFIKGGYTLSRVCTGLDWRPEQTEFLSWVETNSSIKVMFQDAKRARYHWLKEEFLTISRKKKLKDESKQSRRERRLKALEKELKVCSEDFKEKDLSTTVVHTSWLDVSEEEINKKLLDE